LFATAGEISNALRDRRMSSRRKLQPTLPLFLILTLALGLALILDRNQLGALRVGEIFAVPEILLALTDVEKHVEHLRDFGGGSLFLIGRY